MTNWCWNVLVVTGDEVNVSRFKQQASGVCPREQFEAGEKSDVLNFYGIVPMPDAVFRAGSGLDCKEWQIINWGCRVGAVSPSLTSDDDSRLEYFFGTPSSPPLKWLEKASLLWPTLLFELSFLEDILNFRGEATSRAGKLTCKIDTEFGDAIKSGETDEGGDEK